MSWIVNKIFNTKFHDTQLSSTVQNAYHALAVDERRLPFIPTLMEPNKNHNPSNFEQKWFPGVHSNIGGGYAQTGLSDLALKWMTDKATAKGLFFDLGKISNPDFKPNVMEKPEDSHNLAYRIGDALLVKLPGYLSLVPEQYKSALPHVQWNGDYIRAIPNKGNIMPFIGHPPLMNETTDYQGDLEVCLLDKINRCWKEYWPVNVITDQQS